MIPIGERALAWIDRYVTEVRPELAVEPDDGTLFLTNEGTPFTPEPDDPARARLRGGRRARQVAAPATSSATPWRR